MQLLSISNVPAHYHVPIYRELAIKFGDEFLAVFERAGHAKPGRCNAWNEEIFNDAGILEGYNYEILDQDQSLSRIALSWKIINLIRKTKPHAILVNSHRSLLCRIAIEYGALLGSNVILRSTPYDLTQRGLASQLIRDVWLRLAYHNVGSFAAVGTLPRLHFERYSNRPKDVYFSPYCVDEFVLQPYALCRNQLRNKFRDDHDIACNDFVFLFSGRLAEVKRVEWVIRAFRAFREKHKAKLIIAGSGPLFNSVLNLVSDMKHDVVMTGFQNRDGVAQVLSAADAFLLPSKSETWGVVINEAIMFNLPIVTSSNVASGVDLIQEGVTGFIFPAHDELAFHKCLFKVYELSKAGVNQTAFDRISDKYSAKNAVNGILNAING